MVKYGVDETWEEVCDRTTKQIYKHKPKGFNQTDFYEWMLKREKIGYKFDHGMYYRCYKICKDYLKQDNNFTLLATGSTGSGKSTILSQICGTISPDTFNETFICNNIQQFIVCIKKAKPMDSIQIDEAVLASLLNTMTQRAEANDLKSLFAIFRAKRLFVCLAITNFFFMNSYFRHEEIDTLIHIPKRAYYKGFLKQGVQRLSTQSHKTKNVMIIAVPEGYWWTGTFRSTMPDTIDVAAYKKAKDNEINEFIGNLEKKTPPNNVIKATHAAKQLNISRKTMAGWIDRKKIKAKKIGGNWFVSKEEINQLMDI